MNHPSLEDSITHLPKKEQKEALTIAGSLTGDEHDRFVATLTELDAKAAEEQRGALDGMHTLVIDAEHTIRADHRDTQHQKEEREHGQDEKDAASLLDSM